MKWVNFQAWTEFRSPLSWILPAYIRVDGSSTLKTHQLNAGKQKNSLQTYEFQVHESITYEKNQFSFICPFETKFLINRMNKSLQKKKHKTFDNRNFVIHFSKSISTSPLSHNEQRRVLFKSTFPHHCLLTFDWFLSAPGCFWKKRKVSLQPYGRTICTWSPSSAATRGWILMHVEHEIPRKCTDKLHTPVAETKQWHSLYLNQHFDYPAVKRLGGFCSSRKKVARKIKIEHP